jgi:hypothetical protein
MLKSTVYLTMLATRNDQWFLSTITAIFLKRVIIAPILVSICGWVHHKT